MMVHIARQDSRGKHLHERQENNRGTAMIHGALTVLSRFPLLALTLLTTACMPTRLIVLTVPPSSSASIKVVDHRVGKEDRSFLSAQGNIYSCLYGISRIKESETLPERLDYLRSVINGSSVQDAVHVITITRFDIYVNSQAELKDSMPSTITPASGSFAAGAVQGAVGAAAKHNGAVVGCEGTDTGEYAADEREEHGRPVIVYLDGEADGKPFKIRQIVFSKDANGFDKIHLSSEVQECIALATAKLIAELGGPHER
jgi:hypothetical protein